MKNLLVITVLTVLVTLSCFGSENSMKKSVAIEEPPVEIRLSKNIVEHLKYKPVTFQEMEAFDDFIKKLSSSVRGEEHDVALQKGKIEIRRIELRKEDITSKEELAYHMRFRGPEGRKYYNEQAWKHLNEQKTWARRDELVLDGKTIFTAQRIYAPSVFEKGRIAINAVTGYKTPEDRGDIALGTR